MRHAIVRRCTIARAFDPLGKTGSRQYHRLPLARLDYALAAIVLGSMLPAVAHAQDPVAEPRPAVPPSDPAAVDAPPGPRMIKDDHPELAARLEWKYPEFRGYQYGLIGGQVAGAIASLAIPGGERLKGTNPFDEAGRDALRATSYDGQLRARDASDVGLVILINQRLVDTLLITWWFHDKGSTAWQMGMIDAQALTLNAAINGLIAGLAGRERPYGDTICQRKPDDVSSDCTGNNRFRSFYSGHSSTSFTLAALTCAHHMNLPLYGGGPVEALPCVGSMLAAGTVATLRVVGDQHHLSDVLVGSSVGTAIGFAVPYLFHYAWGPVETDEAGHEKPAGVSVSVLPTPMGINVGGSF
jgi:membrane-associated phospholipid phosphatase